MSGKYCPKKENNKNPIATITSGKPITLLVDSNNAKIPKDPIINSIGKTSSLPKIFKSKFNKDTQYTFNIPGIYAYWCTPHKSMGMIGFVVVGGDKSNLDAIKEIRFSAKSKKIAPDLINSL